MAHVVIAIALALATFGGFLFGVWYAEIKTPKKHWTFHLHVVGAIALTLAATAILVPPF